MSDAQKVVHIADLLSSGADNATTARELAAWLGWSEREVTRQIERERRAGAPICATCDNRKPGYFIAASADEIDAYLGRLAHREAEVRRTHRAMMAARAKLAGQMRMNIEGGV